MKIPACISGIIYHGRVGLFLKLIPVLGTPGVCRLSSHHSPDELIMVPTAATCLVRDYRGNM